MTWPPIASVRASSSHLLYHYIYRAVEENETKNYAPSPLITAIASTGKPLISFSHAHLGLTQRCQCQPAPQQHAAPPSLSILASNIWCPLPVSILHQQYHVQWQLPLGEGAFGTVYEATHRDTGTRFAIKRISKRYTLNDAFQRELHALIHVKTNGGHPHICTLHEHYQDSNYYYLILDLLSGGEMFDALVERGAYSELDASRIFRDVTSAIHFLHGIGLIHGDIKPENMLLSAFRNDALVQIVDFGCAHFMAPVTTGQQQVQPRNVGGNTVAYSPPEVLQPHANTAPFWDIWSLGVILYIMLTGLHPFDLSGTATDEEIHRRIQSHEPPPLYNSPITAHLSSSALHVIYQCLQWDPNNRITALELLHHPWVQGQTANPDKIVHSDKKLAFFRKHKSKMEAKVFANLFSWSKSIDPTNSVHKNVSLIERAFHSLDVENKGFLSTADIRHWTTTGQFKLGADGIEDQDDDIQDNLSLSQFSHLISDTMINRYFPSGHLLYHEGDVGEHMYFINSVRCLLYSFLS